MSERPIETPSIRSRFSNDPEMAELIEYFVQEMPERVSAVAELWRDREIEPLSQLVHQLAGACGGYGFDEVGKAARKLEESLRVEEDDLEKVRAEVEMLLDLCRRMTV